MEKTFIGFLVISGIIALLCLLSLQFTARCGKLFGEDVLKSVLGIPLLTRKKYRWNELLTVRERYPYVGTRDAYVEARAATYTLFGLIVVYVKQYRIEIETNTIISVMTVGSSISGAQLNSYFPTHLAYKTGFLGKAGAMGERSLYVSGSGL